MLIRLIEIHSASGSVGVREVYLNPSNIVSITEEHQHLMLEETVSLGLSQATRFSSVLVQEGGRTRAITVAHSPEEIHKKINPSKTLLKG